MKVKAGHKLPPSANTGRKDSPIQVIDDLLNLANLIRRKAPIAMGQEAARWEGMLAERKQELQRAA